jgi:carnitine O-acetyltransferase
MQLAYALTHNGQPAATYESAQTRRFALGRTEVVRVCTEATRAWTQAMLQTGNTSATEQRRLFRAAVEQQGRDMKDANAGLGIDRHLLGLKLCLESSESAPTLFSDPVYVRSSHWLMSTSYVARRSPISCIKG